MPCGVGGDKLIELLYLLTGGGGGGELMEVMELLLQYLLRAGVVGEVSGDWSYLCCMLCGDVGGDELMEVMKL